MKLLDSHNVATSQSHKTMVGNKPGEEMNEGSYLSTQPNKQTSYR